MANIVDSSSIVLGTEQADVIVATGGTGSGTVNAGGGDDLVFGDHHRLFIDAGAGNNESASAMNIDNTSYWSFATNPDIGNPNSAYTTILGTGAGETDFFTVTVGAGETLTLDVDWARSTVGGAGFDSVLVLRDAGGALLAANDDSDPTLGGGGSDSVRDSRLVFTNNGAAAVFNIQIGAFSGNVPPPAGSIASGQKYMLNVSVTNHASVGTTSGADVLNGGAGDDVLYGVDGVDTLNGEAGDDVLDGGASGDTLNGGLGDDLLKGGLALDTLDGGAGVDTADFRDKNGPIQVTLTGAADATVTVGGDAGDTIRNVENIFGGAGADSVTGDSFANLFRGSAGVDFFNGFGGLDTIDFSDQFASVVLTLNGGSNVNAVIGGVDFDTLRNVENIIGGTAVDTLTGDSLANVFRGGGGADQLNGAGGSDTVDFSDATGSVVLTLAGAANSTATINTVASDVVRSIENVIGGDSDDTITGDGFDNSFRSGGGADQFNGFGGRDTIDFSDKTASVVLKLTGGVVATATVGGISEDQVRNVENIIGGLVGDTLTGDALDNALSGLAGADKLRGGGGADRLAGGLGADVFVYGPALSDSTVLAAGRDTIIDFATGDKIDLTLIDGNTVLGGNQAFNLALPVGSAGRLTITSLGGGDWLVQGFVDANGTADFGILVEKAVGNLVGADFLL